MREIIADGDRPCSPEFEAEVVRDAQLAEEFERHMWAALVSFLAEHPGAAAESICPVLIEIADVQTMAGVGMGPDDFAELARYQAKSSEGKAKQIREHYRKRGRS